MSLEPKRFLDSIRNELDKASKSDKINLRTHSNIDIDVSPQKYMTNREGFEPQGQKESRWNRPISRRGVVKGFGVTAAGIAAFGFVGCGSESGKGNDGANEHPTPTPETDFKVGEAIVKIENLPNGVNELIFGNAYPQNLVVRKGSTLSTKYMFADDEGQNHAVVTVTDPERKTEDGKDATFTGIIPDKVTAEQKQQGMASYEALVGMNGAVYESKNGRSTLALKDGTKKQLPLAGETDVEKDKEEVGAFFVDRDPLKKDHPLLENPIVAVPAPESVPDGGKISQETDGRVVLKDANGVDVARARYYPWKKEWKWVKDPESVSDFTIREFADAQGMIFGVFDADFRTSESRRKGEDFIGLVEKTANQLVMGGAEMNEVFKNFNAADWRGVLDNWDTIKAQFGEGKLPAGKYLWNSASTMVEYAKAHGMSIRAQHLIWGADLPDSIYNGNFTPTELSNILEYTVKARVAKYKGMIQEWDVPDEAAASIVGDDPRRKFWYAKLGETVIDKVAGWVKEVDPEAKLVMVEDHIIEGATLPNTVNFFKQTSTKAFELMRHFKAAGVPIDKIGIENNLWVYMAPTKDQMKSVLKQIQGMGFDIGSAEANVGSYSEEGFFPALRTNSPVGDPFELQAKVFADMVSAYVEVGADFALGGLTDATVWTAAKHKETKPTIFDENKKPKPAYFAIKDVLKSKVVANLSS